MPSFLVAAGDELARQADGILPHGSQEFVGDRQVNKPLQAALHDKSIEGEMGGVTEQAQEEHITSWGRRYQGGFLEQVMSK